MDMNKIFEKMDWDLLREQKAVLINVIEDIEEYSDDDNAPDLVEALTGILHLLDAIMDTAHDHHFPVMFLTEDEDEDAAHEEDLRIIRKAGLDDE